MENIKNSKLNLKESNITQPIRNFILIRFTTPYFKTFKWLCFLNLQRRTK